VLQCVAVFDSVLQRVADARSDCIIPIESHTPSPTPLLSLYRVRTYSLLIVAIPHLDTREQHTCHTSATHSATHTATHTATHSATHTATHTATHSATHSATLSLIYRVRAYSSSTALTPDCRMCCIVCRSACCNVCCIVCRSACCNVCFSVAHRCLDVGWLQSRLSALFVLFCKKALFS